MIRAMRLVPLVGLWLALAVPSQAAALYVNSSGSPVCSDATVKASNSAATPWCTIHRAAKGGTIGAADSAVQAASAGDVVNITCGFYEAVGSSEQRYVALNPVNSGTAGNPIRFQAVGNVFHCIRVTPHASGDPGGGSIIGSTDRNYIEWAGFDLNETDWPWDIAFDNQNGKALFNTVGATPTIVGGVVERSRLVGTAVDGRDGDNYTLVRVDRAQITVRNNTMGPAGLDGHNNSCFTSYRGTGLIIENNLMVGCGAGIYLKNNDALQEGTSQHVVRYNWIESVSYGIYCLQNCNGALATPVLIYQNVIIGGQFGIYNQGLGHVQDPSFTKVFNNTIYGVSDTCFVIGVQKDNATHEYWNNICDGGGVGPQAIMSTGGADAGDVATTVVLFEHNLYNEIGFTFANLAGPGVKTLATWKSDMGQDSTVPAAVSANPQFVSAGTNFHLASNGQSALTLGRAKFAIGGSDGATIPVGAYITDTETIGIQTGSGSEVIGKIRLRIRGEH